MIMIKIEYTYYTGERLVLDLTYNYTCILVEQNALQNHNRVQSQRCVENALLLRAF